MKGKTQWEIAFTEAVGLSSFLYDWLKLIAWDDTSLNVYVLFLGFVFLRKVVLITAVNHSTLVPVSVRGEGFKVTRKWQRGSRRLTQHTLSIINGERISKILGFGHLRPGR